MQLGARIQCALFGIRDEFKRECFLHQGSRTRPNHESFVRRYIISPSGNNSAGQASAGGDMRYEELDYLLFHHYFMRLRRTLVFRSLGRMCIEERLR
jgi:hypothetical protein